jgi:hypothetical protein
MIIAIVTKILFSIGMIIYYFISMKQSYEYGFWAGALRAAEAMGDEDDDRPLSEKIGGPSPWRDLFRLPDDGRGRTPR